MPRPVCSAKKYDKAQALTFNVTLTLRGSLMVPKRRLPHVDTWSLVEGRVVRRQTISKGRGEGNGGRYPDRLIKGNANLIFCCQSRSVAPRYSFARNVWSCQREPVHLRSCLWAPNEASYSPAESHVMPVNSIEVGEGFDAGRARVCCSSVSMPSKVC